MNERESCTFYFRGKICNLLKPRLISRNIAKLLTVYLINGGERKAYLFENHLNPALKHQ